jgi:Zn-dependent peptidase ImmA (M78 family)
MALPNKPPAWANKISILLQEVQKLTGQDTYPVKIQDIAFDISKNFFPGSPITKITGEALSDRFEGMLKKVPNTKDDWGIIYNTAIRSPGRINFTLAHELGHYLLHRLTLEGGIIQCSRRDMMSWNSEYGLREAEANEFASYLLMPRNLFEKFMGNEQISLHLMQHIANQFNVSLTSVLLKWLQFTTKRAMLIVGRDGYIDWVWSSKSLRKSGVYLQPKKEPIELPPASLAMRLDDATDGQTGIMHKAGIWPFAEDVHEMTVKAEAYDMTITLLMFPDDAPNKFVIFDEADETLDAYEKFQALSDRTDEYANAVQTQRVLHY